MVPSMAFGLLARPRLLNCVAREDAPAVTLLLAPGGYGKSVLLAQLLDNVPRSLRVDGRLIGQDAVALAQALIDELRPYEPETAAQLAQKHAQMPLAALQLAQALPPRGCLWLIDHAEHIQGSAETWLLEWLRALSTPHRLVLAGRSLSRYELPLLVASGVAQVVGPEELALNDAEIAQLCKEGGHSLTPDALASLRGWPLAVRLTLSGAYGQNVPSLLRAMLGALPAEVRDVLPYLAPYARWSPSLPAELGYSLPADWQQQLVLASLPVLQTPDGQVAAHEALLAVLEEQLRQQPDWQSAYQQAAARLVAAEPLRALELLMAAGRQQEALELAHEVTREAAERGQFVTISRLLGQFSEDVLASFPRLQARYGVSLLETGQMPQGVAVLEQVAAGPERWRVLPDLAYGYFLRSQLTDAERVTAEAMAFEPDYDDASKVRLLTVQGLILRDTGENERSLEALAKAERLVLRQTDVLPLAMVRSAQSVTYFRLHRSDEALAASQDALRLFEEAGALHRMPTPLVNLAVSFRSRDRLEEAKQALLRAQELAQVQKSRVLASVVFGLANTEQLLGQFETAAQTFGRAAAVALAHGRLDFQFLAYALQSETYRALEQHTLANQALSVAESLMTHEQLRSNQVLAHLLGFLQGQRAWAAGQLDEAAERFTQLPSGLGGLTGWHSRAQLYLALMTQQRGQLTKAHLAPFVEAHERQEGRSYLVPDLDRMQPVLQEAVARGWFVTALTPLLRAEAASRPQLQVDTLGGLVVSLNGQPLGFIGSNVARARELLALLVVLPPPTSADLQRALIGAGKGDHRNALNSLRRTLQAAGLRETVIQDEQRRYHLHPHIHVSTDLARLRAALHSGEPQQLRELLHKGTFLPEFGSDWVNDWREEEVTPLRVEGYLELGRQAVEGGRYQEAQEWYHQALALDPLQDRARRTLLELKRAQQDTDGRAEVNP